MGNFLKNYITNGYNFVTICNNVGGMIKMEFKKFRKGFTIIELIVVMSIIGILVLLAAPRFLGKIHASKLLMVRTESKNISDLLTLELLYKNNENILEGRVTEINKKGLLDKQDENKSINNKIFFNGNNSYLDKNDNSNPELNQLLIDQEKGVLYKINKNKAIQNTKSKLNGDFFTNLDGEIYYVSSSSKDFIIDTESKQFTEDEVRLGIFADIYKMIDTGDIYNAENKIKLTTGNDNIILNQQLKNKYDSMKKDNLGTLVSPKSWNNAQLTKKDDVYKVNFNSNRGPGGFGIITDRNKTWDMYQNEEYIILFELKSKDMRALRYNYIISDSGNKVLPNIQIHKKGEWNKITMKIASSDKDRKNTGILIGGDTRHINSGSEFEIRNVVVSKIQKP